ncbi:MAG: hypothetical protein V1867_04565 [Candidatus Falkowbacteria bacterium]
MPTTYKEARREFNRAKIKTIFKENQSAISAELLNTPLRRLAYENDQDLIDALGGKLRIFLVVELSRYIVENNLDFDQDITLKEAVIKI